MTTGMTAVPPRRSGGVATIELGGSGGFHPPAVAAAADLPRALHGLLADRTVRAVLLCGFGSAAVGAGTSPSPAVAQMPSDVACSVVTTVRTAPVPFVASVEGECVATDVLIALACDLVVAADSASFAIPAASLDAALSGDLGPLLVDRIGIGRASELCLLGDKVSAKQALDWGVLNAVHPAGETRAAAAALTARLAAGPTVALASTKQVLASAARSAPGVRLDRAATEATNGDGRG
ncbi:enoyl-CoA hydratase/isomerase family protein [Amycolatopsis sp. K13G38]|uniref:Enoyl-CoA hydratase/isomerase family protein n=1 Tax=Amycolatopsis acididurans TaxID=2724524 RepID=A0ABX1J8P9_9PSEU|nr:enoyl-CoA hydratase/isomerase family protein [Amycolatopsis acididurans]NKQ56178.1 enoyl-CoA hydratase/isomerase family protein [Amycolatopsis acididurans]